MNRRLTIHAGANKTGSSAIQAFLKRNKDVLLQSGVLVPDMDLRLDSRVEGHHVWYFDQRKGRAAEDCRTELATLVGQLFTWPDARQVIISAENLGNNDNDYANWFGEAINHFDCELVIYLRRQDDFLLSSWQQWHAKSWPDFWSWLVASIGPVGNWRQTIERWEKVIGRERIRVRLFEPARLLQRDVVEDFCQFLAARDPTLVNDRSNVINPSYNDAVVDLITGGQLFAGPHDNEFYHFLQRRLGSSVLKRKGESPITYEQRKAIVDRYRQSNAWVRQNYFAGDDVPDTLFTPPQPGDYKVSSTDQLRKEQIQMLAKLVFELEKSRQK